MRDPITPLPPSEARCRPSRECRTKATCARFVSRIPAHGASVMDGTAHGLVLFFCDAFVPLRRAQEDPPRPVKPTPRGIA